MVGAALFAPVAAWAHGGGTFTAPNANAPTIDGTLGAAEWADASSYALTFGSFPATVYFKEDGTNLYVAVAVQDPGPGPSPRVSAIFDNNHDGLKNAGDDDWLAFPTFGSDFFFDPLGAGGASHYNDLNDGGANDTVAAGASGAGQVVFEMAHPLCSADTAHDICASPGQTVGVDFQYEPDVGPGVFYNAPGPDLLDPSNNWADLSIGGDITPPDVTLTQPEAGSILRSTVNVAATASDNVGVARVDFIYRGRPTPGAPLVDTVIGSDTTAPYSMSFDTTQFPNSLVKDSAVFARAYDSANNSTFSVGNAVTIDNTGPGTIVFESNRDGNSEIWSMDPDGANLKQLTHTDSSVVNGRPSISPDGRTIVFERDTDGDEQIFSIKYDGSNEQQLTTSAQGNNGAPAFSPDGTKIAFQSDRATFKWQIYVMNADGSSQTRVTNDTANDVSPSWNPAGTRLAIDSDRSGNQDIWTVSSSDGSGGVNLTSNFSGFDGDPDWSPDGQTILFVTQRPTISVWKMNADGTGQQDITNANNYDADVAWAPDGKHLAFVRDAGGQDFNVWTARPSHEIGGGNVDFGNAQLQLTDDPCIGYTVSDQDTKTYVIQAPPSSANCDITQDRSTAGNTPASITFDNQSGRTVDIYWLDYEGNRVYYNTLGNENSYTQPTWITHPWVIVGHGAWRNSFPDWGPVPARATSASVGITGPATAIAGAKSVPISSIPVDAIRGASSQTSAATPLGGIALGGIPLGGIALGGIALGGIPLGGIGFNTANLTQNGLGGLPLSTIPLKLPDTWDTHLAGTAYAGMPLQSVTLAQVLGESTVSGVTLDKLDLASSALGGIPLAGIALGGIPLGGIALGGIATPPADQTTKNLNAWCDYINRQPGFEGTCSGGSSLANDSMMDLALGGIPLGGIALGGIALGGIDLSGTALGGIPLGGIALGGIALGGIPLGGINISGTALGGIALGGINLGLSALGGIPLGGIPLGGIALGGIPLAGISTTAQNAIFTCGTNCSYTTLAQAAAAGAIKDTAKLRDLGRYTDANGNPVRVEDLHYYCVPGTPADAVCRSGETPILLENFIKGLPPNVTLEDLLGALLNRAAYDWEALPFDIFPLQDFSSDGGVVTYHVPFSVNGSGAGAVDARISVHLPLGARYSPPTTITAPATVNEPTLLQNTNENELTWQVRGITLGSSNELVFQAKPGLVLGTETATAKIGVTGLATVAGTQTASTQITPTFSANGTPSTAAPIDPDTLYVGYTPNGNAKSYFKIPVPAAGTQVTVHLSHLHVDDDVVVFGPTAEPLRNAAGHAAATPVSAPDVPYSLQQKTQVITPEALTDVPQALAGQQTLGVSDNRGLADEEVSIGTPEDVSGSLTIQITSYDGGYSDQPWQLRVEETPPPALPLACSQPPKLGVGTAQAMPTIPSGASTLYLINAKRYGDLYGATAESNVMAKLKTLASRTDAAGGAVVPVESDPGVNSKYNAWTDPNNPRNYCSPGKTNDVVRAIGTMLDRIVPASVKYIVLVGDDPVIPYGRILDNTSFANEHGYATTFFGANNNEYLSTYGLGFLPSDDPYGDKDYIGTGPYVPELAVSRLVETPQDIIAQVDRYIARNGAVAPTRSVVAGYDFLKDGSSAIATSLKNGLGTSSTQAQLITDSWDKTALSSALFPGGTAPEIDSINAHFDHHRLLPANENAAGTESNLFTTTNISPGAVANRIGFSMGCHSGVAVADSAVALTLQPDWPRTWTGDSASGGGGGLNWMGNTGFGLGDTAAVAYSERLNALFAARLDGTMTVGQALTFAKQDYAAAPTLSGYDLKVINEAAMYGLPMYSLGNGTPAIPSVASPKSIDPTTGLASVGFTITPNFGVPTTAPDGSKYYTINGSASFVDRRPIEPTTTLDVTEPDLVAHGAVITGAVSIDENPFRVTFSHVVEDLSSLTPPLVGDAVFPSKLQSITSLNTPMGPRQRLGLYAGQFRSGSTVTPDIGLQRKFTSLSGTILYTAPSVTDFSPPTFGPVSVTAAGGTVGFAVDVGDPDGATDVKRVFALYKDASGTWQKSEFSANGTRWSGAGAVSGTSVEWFIQAVDRAGNVGVTSNKAAIESLVQPDPVGNITATLIAAHQPVNGWYIDPVTVKIEAGAGVNITKSVDGVPFTAYSPPLQVSGTGVHVVAFKGSDGSSGATTVPIDVTVPTITQSTTAWFEVNQTNPPPPYVCSDAGSGIASCTSTVLNLSSVTSGTTTRSLTVTAVDRVGNQTTATVPYRVYAFKGFFSPIMNLPNINIVGAGSAVPVKFSLTGNRGLNIFGPGSPSSQRIKCDATAPSGLVSTMTAGKSSLGYDSKTDTYTYTWKTDPGWIGTCRQLVVTLLGGAPKVANFQFK